MKAYKLSNSYLEIKEIEIEGWSKTDNSLYIKGRQFSKHSTFCSHFQTFEEAKKAQMQKGLNKISTHQKEIERIEKALGINCQKPEKVSYPVKMCDGCNTKSFIETGLHEGFCTNCTRVSRLIKDYKRRS